MIVLSAFTVAMPPPDVTAPVIVSVSPSTSLSLASGLKVTAVSSSVVTVSVPPTGASFTGSTVIVTVWFTSSNESLTTYSNDAVPLKFEPGVKITVSPLMIAVPLLGFSTRRIERMSPSASVSPFSRSLIWIVICVSSSVEKASASGFGAAFKNTSPSAKLRMRAPLMTSVPSSPSALGSRSVTVTDVRSPTML